MVLLILGICELLIDEQCKITVIKISTDLPKQISKDLYKALSKNKSVTELKCQNYESEDLSYLKALKKNTRIHSLSINAPRAKLARYLKHNHTITIITVINIQEYEDTLDVLAAVGTLERVSLHFHGTKITNLSSLLKGNKRLKQLHVVAKDSTLNDADAPKAIQDLSSLTSLDIDITGTTELSALVLALPKDSNIKHLAIPEQYLLSERTRDITLQKIKSLKYVTFRASTARG